MHQSWAGCTSFDNILSTHLLSHGRLTWRDRPLLSLNVTRIPNGVQGRPMRLFDLQPPQPIDECLAVLGTFLCGGPGIASMMVRLPVLMVQQNVACAFLVKPCVLCPGCFTMRRRHDRCMCSEQCCAGHQRHHQRSLHQLGGQQPEGKCHASSCVAGFEEDCCTATLPAVPYSFVTTALTDWLNLDTSWG